MPPPTQDPRFLESRQPLPLPLQSRQYASNGDTIAIPAIYQGLNSGPSPGVVVGIVLGSVFAFLFFVWLLWTLSNGGGWIRANRDEEESVVVARSRHHGSRSGGGEKRRSTNGRRDRVYRSERVVRDFPSAPPRDQSRSRVRETVIVDDFVVPPRERRVDGDDVVEVIEEHSDIVPPRRKSRRGSGGGGYRRGQDSDLGY